MSEVPLYRFGAAPHHAGAEVVLGTFPSPTRWKSRASFAPNLEGYVTECALHQVSFLLQYRTPPCGSPQPYTRFGAPPHDAGAEVVLGTLPPHLRWIIPRGSKHRGGAVLGWTPNPKLPKFQTPESKNSKPKTSNPNPHPPDPKPQSSNPKP